MHCKASPNRHILPALHCLTHQHRAVPEQAWQIEHKHNGDRESQNACPVCKGMVNSCHRLQWCAQPDTCLPVMTVRLR